MNRELSGVQAGFEKGRGIRDQIANIHWIIKKAREFQKNIYFCFIDYAKASDSVYHNKLWKILKERGIPDHLTRLLRNVYAGQEATVRTGHGTTDWFQIRKGVCQGCILSPCLFNLYAGCCCCCKVSSVMSNSARPLRRQPTRLRRPWDSPGKNTGVGCHFLLQCMKVKMKSLSCVRLSVTPWTAAHQAPLAMGFSRQEYGSGLPLPPPHICRLQHEKCWNE